MATVDGGRSRHRLSLLRARPVAVVVFEQAQRLGPSFVEPVVEDFRDADRLVVVADLGLVVPEDRQAVVATDAVQAQLEYFAAAASGVDDRLPDVADAAVVDVVVREKLQVLFISQGAGDLVTVVGVRSRPSRPSEGRPCRPR
jgi:hypothetical protein